MILTAQQFEKLFKLQLFCDKLPEPLAIEAMQAVDEISEEIKQLNAVILKLSDEAWEMRTVDELSKPAKNWR